jgi:hypothetical protein
MTASEIHDLLSARVAREPLLFRYRERQLAKLEADFLKLLVRDEADHKRALMEQRVKTA